MKKYLKTILVLILFTICFFTCNVASLNVKAENGSSNKTYTLDASNNLIPTQDAYLAVKSIKKIKDESDNIITFNQPEDIYYQEDIQKFYIADTKNKRIVVLNNDYETGTIIGEGILEQPRGVFVNKAGDIYVADYGKQAVIIFKAESAYTTYDTITKPTHPIYTESSNNFLPSKIVVDHVGTMYIIDAGNGNGIVTITKDYEFSGYFGANYVKPDFKFVLKFMFASKEQRKKLYVSPISPTNLAIDDNNLINTISAMQGQAVKKLNISGTNLFSSNLYDYTSYSDIAIGDTGTIYCVSKDEGVIVEYDQEGHLLFEFGGKDNTGTYTGLFTSPTSIETDEKNNLYVLDGNSIQVFVQTEFAALVHKALSLYQDGLYAESREPWEQVLQMNNMFDLAHRGLGNAYLREMNYDKALSEFKLAKDTAAYSDAYWEVRNTWLKDSGYAIFITIICIIIVIALLNKFHLLDPVKKGLRKVKEKIFKCKLIEEVCYIKKFIKHPLDGFYEIKHCNKMSPLAATILYIWFFILTILGAYFTGFVFNAQDKETISLIKLAVQSVIPLVLFVLTNYLISSITEGNAKLKDVYVGSICALAPVLLFMPIVILLSNFIVDSEAFLYTMPVKVLWGWSFALMYFMVKDLQELQFGENNKNIILTIFTMVLFVAFAFLVYILGNQLVSFISDIIREVVSRG